MSMGHKGRGHARSYLVQTREFETKGTAIPPDTVVVVTHQQYELEQSLELVCCKYTFTCSDNVGRVLSMTVSSSITLYTHADLPV